MDELELELELELLTEEEDEEEEEEEDEDEEPQTSPATWGTSAAVAPLVPCMPNSMVWLGWIVRFQSR